MHLTYSEDLPKAHALQDFFRWACLESFEAGGGTSRRRQIAPMPVVGFEMSPEPCHCATGIYFGVHPSIRTDARLPVSLTTILGLHILNFFKAEIEKERLSEDSRTMLFSSPWGIIHRCQVGPWGVGTLTYTEGGTLVKRQENHLHLLQINYLHPIQISYLT